MERHGYNFGDSWMMTWAGDGRTFTNFSDGRFVKAGPKPSNAILTIDDDPPDLRPESFVKVSADPLDRRKSWAHYIINTIFVGDTLYVGAVNFAYDAGIARSDDMGKTLIYDQEKPMWSGKARTRFVYPSFLQNGRGYSGNTDGYMYVYGSDGVWGRTNVLRLARVPTDRIEDITAYEYYTGTGWSRNQDDAAVLLRDGTNLGGMQSIVYNPVLERYFLITFGDTYNHRARMVLYDAPQPWGPWHRCGMIAADDALFLLGELRTKIYNPSFNAKWIDADGSMWISYANYTPQYSFHYGKLTVRMKQPDRPPTVPASSDPPISDR